MFRLLNVTVYIFSLLVGSWLRHTIWVIWVICFSDTSGLACITNHFPLLTWHLNRARLHIYIGLHIASHAKRILELRAAYRLVLVHITCIFAYVHTHARGTTVIRQMNTHTHSFLRAPNSATPSSPAHQLTHTSPHSFNSLVSYI